MNQNQDDSFPVKLDICTISAGFLLFFFAILIEIFFYFSSELWWPFVASTASVAVVTLVLVLATPISIHLTTSSIDVRNAFCFNTISVKYADIISIEELQPCSPRALFVKIMLATSFYNVLRIQTSSRLSITISPRNKQLFLDRFYSLCQLQPSPSF